MKLSNTRRLQLIKLGLQLRKLEVGGNHRASLLFDKVKKRLKNDIEREFNAQN